MSRLIDFRCTFCSFPRRKKTYKIHTDDNCDDTTASLSLSVVVVITTVRLIHISGILSRGSFLGHVRTTALRLCLLSSNFASLYLSFGRSLLLVHPDS